MTSMLRPLDVHLNKPFKDRMLQLYRDRLCEDQAFTHSGRMKQQTAKAAERVPAAWWFVNLRSALYQMAWMAQRVTSSARKKVIKRARPPTMSAMKVTREMGGGGKHFITIGKSDE